MSEKKFQQSKGSLAFSQKLLDNLKSQNMAQQSPEIGTSQSDQLSPTNAPQSPQNAPQQAQQANPQQMITQAVSDAMVPYVDQITKLVQKQDEDTKKVEVILQGEMTPQEDMADSQP